MYKKYDQSVKDIIIKTNNINALPHLNIPRTTALYWINQSKKTIKNKSSLPSIYERELNSLKQKLCQEKAKTFFLSEVCKVYKQKDKSLDKSIADTILKFKKYLSIKILCKLASFEEKKYYKFHSPYNEVIYKQSKPNQLTEKEQRTLISLSRNKKYKYLSLKQLQLYASRKNLLHCHYDTWRKYVLRFNIQRKAPPRINQRKHRKSITTSKLNYVWHIDTTYFKKRDGKHLYIQVVLDNFSGFIVSAKVSSKRNKYLTLNNLK